MAWEARYYAWDTSNNVGKTGDGANHTIVVEVEGTEVTGLSVTELGNGQYKVDPSDAQLPEGSQFSVNGSSSTSNVQIIGEASFRPKLSVQPDNKPTVDASGHTEAIDTDGTAFNDFDPSSDTVATVTDVTNSVDINMGQSLPASPTADTTGQALTDADDNLDAAVSSRSSHSANDVTGGTNVATAESNIRGADSDDLKTLSDAQDTLLSRITSDLFSGITSLAEWLGLLAGKQTGDSTARTEVRATGAGSGTYDETTDSQEAIRDNQLTTPVDANVTQWLSTAPASLNGDKVQIDLQTWRGAAPSNLTGSSFVQVDVQNWVGTAPNFLSSGHVQVDLRAIHASSFTESVDGNIAGAFSTFFDVGSTSNNVNSAPLGTAMRGTDNALLASSAPTNFGDMSIQATSGEVKIIETTAAGNTILTTGNVTLSGGDVVATLDGEAVDLNMGQSLPGAPTDGTIGDALAQAETLTFSSGDVVATLDGETVTVGTNNDKTGYALTSAERNSVADAILTRDVSNVEASLGEHTLGTIILGALEFDVSGTTYTIFQTDHATTHLSKTLSTDANADPVTGVD